MRSEMREFLIALNPKGKDRIGESKGCTVLERPVCELNRSSSNEATPVVRESRRNINGARKRSAGFSSRHVWTVYVALIYAYLYLCMFRGAPFFAFDHENYINFLNDPVPFFFEPGYTVAAYAVNLVFNEEWRFPVMFALFTLPPVLIVWSGSLRRGSSPVGMMLFACVLTKSFFIGYVSQRFFFAELWMAALLIRAGLGMPRTAAMLVPSALHFAALSTMPALHWVRSRLTWRKISIALILLIGSYVYIRLISGLQFFYYDYSRYLSSEDTTGGFPIFTVLEMIALALICLLILPSSARKNYVFLVGLVLLFKVLFTDIEVFSRIFQIQVDFVIVAVGLLARRGHVLLFLFSLGFLLLQAFFTPMSIDMLNYHTTAFLNALRSF